MSRPDWTCAECGGRGPFRNITYDIPGEPIEHDIECPLCGCVDIRESAADAASALGDRLDTLRAESVPRALAVQLFEALADLTQQIEACEFRDVHGHPAKNMQALHVARAALDAARKALK